MKLRPRTPFPLVLIGGPVAGVAGWLLFSNAKGQPTSASFWFAVFSALAFGIVVGLLVTRRVGNAAIYGVLATLLALTAWLLYLAVFLASDPS